MRASHESCRHTAESNPGMIGALCHSLDNPRSKAVALTGGPMATTCIETEHTEYLFLRRVGKARPAARVAPEQMYRYTGRACKRLVERRDSPRRRSANAFPAVQ